MQMATRRRPHKGLLALSTTAVVLAAALIAPPASASDHAGTTEQAVKVLEDQGLLKAQGTDMDGTADVSASRGLTVDAQTASVSMRPVTSAPGTSIDGKSVVVYGASAFTYVVTGSDTAANAGYAVIAGPSAPSEYRYAFTVDGKPATLDAEDGTIYIRDGQGNVVNMLGRAWANDAAGTTMKSWYTIEGNAVVQHVEHRGAAYPVVADPRLQCNGVFCTMEYKRSETQILANWGGTAGGLIASGCTAIGGAIAGAACALGSGIVSSTASTALSQKKCFGMRAFIYVPIVTTHAVVVNCYA